MVTLAGAQRRDRRLRDTPVGLGLATTFTVFVAFAPLVGLVLGLLVAYGVYGYDVRLRRWFAMLAGSLSMLWLLVGLFALTPWGGPTVTTHIDTPRMVHAPAQP